MLSSRLMSQQIEPAKLKHRGDRLLQWPQRNQKKKKKNIKLQKDLKYKYIYDFCLFVGQENKDVFEQHLQVGLLYRLYRTITVLIYR